MNVQKLLAVVLLVACKDDETMPAAPAVGSASGSGSAAHVERDAMPSAWAKLLGEKPGTLGPTFDVVRFGAIDLNDLTIPSTWSVIIDESRRRERAPEGSEPRASVTLEVYQSRLTGIRVELYTARGSIPEDSCATFVEALEAKWGASPDRVWSDRDGHVRMAFLDTCRLRFERWVDVASWIGPEATSIVPVALVGKHTKEMASRGRSG